MALTTSVIKSRLATAPWPQKDNEAQKLINEATTVELKSIDAEGVLRLCEALVMLPPRVFSKLDAAALKRLADNTQFQPVTNTPEVAIGMIKSARMGQPVIQAQLTAELVNRIYAAEKKRMSWFESHGIDGSTIGRGQLGQSAYEDVKSTRGFKTTWEAYLTRVRLSRILCRYANSSPSSDAPGFDMKNYTVVIPANYKDIYNDAPLEDFVAAAYLAIRINTAIKPARTFIDTTRFAVALYHGMSDMVRAAQEVVKKNQKDEIQWAPVEEELLKKHSDEVAYVNEVVVK